MPDGLYRVPPCRILVAEDHPLIGVLLAEMLEDLGHSVCAIAATQAKAIAAAAEHAPGLIIADARLGLGSGLAAIADILRSRLIPHIFMNGAIHAVREARPYAVLLEKPFQREHLRRAIHAALILPPLHAAPAAA